jgi:hypothetical protein
MAVWLDDTIKGMQVEPAKAEKPVKRLRTEVGLLTEEAKKAAATGGKEFVKFLENVSERAREDAFGKLRVQLQGLTTTGLQPFVESGRTTELLLVPAFRDWNAELVKTGEQLTKAAQGANLFETEAEQTARIIKEAGEASERTAAQVARAAMEVEGLLMSLADFGSLIGGGFGDTISHLAESWMAGAAAAQAYAQATTAAGKASALIQGAGAVWQATGAQGKGKAIGGGAIAGAKMGMAFGPYGAAIGAAAGAITGWIRSMDDGRDMVKKFTTETFGSFDKLQKKLMEFGSEGEQLWIQLTQKVGKGNVKQAEDAIAAIEALLAKGTMAEQVAAMGYQTKSELRGIAEQAVKVWEFMRDSGEYSAEAVQQAWERANEALVAAGAPSALQAQNTNKQIDALKVNLQALDTEYDRLYATIANEAPEEHMGVVEQQTREQLAIIDTQRKETQKQIEDATKSMVDGFGGVTDAVYDLTAALRDLTKDSWRPHLDWSGMGGLETPAGGSGGGTEGTADARSYDRRGGTLNVVSQVFMNDYEIAEGFSRAVLA